MSEVVRERFDVIVAGAGIAGMAAAHVLADAGLRVMVLEKSSAPGGKCFSYVDEALGHTVEHGVHGIFPRYVNLTGLFRDAGIDEAIFTGTRTTGMAGPGRTMRSTELARARGPAPLFLLRMLPKGVLRLRDFVFAFPFLVRTYASRYEDGASLDETTFGAMLRGAGVSARMARLLLVPYVRNLAYARGDEVSAHVASLALGYYVVEDSEAVKARWIDGGPSARIFEPWRRALEARGVAFAFDRPVDAIALEGRRFVGFVTETVIRESELGATRQLLMRRLGPHFLGLSWEPEERRLRAFSGACTHRGCPLVVATTGPQPSFHCPCHGGAFDAEGRVLGGPPTEPLPEIRMRRDEGAGVWFVGGEAGGSSGGHAGVVEADYGIVAMDLSAVQRVLPVELSRAGDTAGIPLLRTTSVLVMRLRFMALAGMPRWSGPDSGVFAAEDLLDNFFALHTFQREFDALPDLFLECHVSDSEGLRVVPDDEVLRRALDVLEAYFPEEKLGERLDRARSRILRHEDVFPLFAPGDLRRTPTVSDDSRPNLMFAGDWIRPDDPAHRSFFMERAAVTGIEAANAILSRKGLADRRRAIASPRSPALGWALALPLRAAATLRAAMRRLLGLDE